MLVAEKFYEQFNFKESNLLNQIGKQFASS